MAEELPRAPIVNKTVSLSYKGCQYSATFNKDMFVYGEQASAMCTFDNSQGTGNIEKIKFKLVRNAIYKHGGLFNSETDKEEDVRFAEYGGLKPGQKK